MTSLEFISLRPDQLDVYARVSIAFEVRTIFRVQEIGEDGMGGLRLIEEAVDSPYVKDYDRVDSDDAHPTAWPHHFNVRNWKFLLAREAGEPVGAATIAIDTPGVRMLEGRTDLAVLWDIRVQPKARGRGVGAALFERAFDWSRRQGCTTMKIETQNVNLPACRFYARMGCELGAIHRYAYAGIPEVADEVMLLWYLKL